jgi:hypothetical protein
MATHTFDRSPLHNAHSANGPWERPAAVAGPFGRLLTLVALCAALLGAGSVTGMLFSVGALGGTTNSAFGSSGSSAPASALSLNASAIYAKAAAGAVSIALNGTSTSARLPTTGPANRSSSRSGGGRAASR